MTALPLSMVAAQTVQPKTVNASVSVVTSDDRRAVAVVSKGAGNEAAFLFCVDLAAPLPQKIAFAGPARVVYRPLPAVKIPAGIKVEGPENVTSALAVLPSAGKGWLFLAKNEATVLPAGDAAAKDATTVPVKMVRRVDWVAADGGPRRGMDVEGCFTVGG
jgi:hypothetical protein